jgi:hypothetical protein
MNNLSIRIKSEQPIESALLSAPLKVNEFWQDSPITIAKKPQKPPFSALENPNNNLENADLSGRNLAGINWFE